MAVNPAERLLRSLGVPATGGAAGELRTYIRRLERMAMLAGRMYDHEIALRHLLPGEYRCCVRCSFRYRSEPDDPACPFCCYREARPNPVRLPLHSLPEAA